MEWTQNLIAEAKKIIDEQELSEYDVEDIEVYASACNENNTWSIAIGDYWVDATSPRLDSNEEMSEKAFEASKIVREELRKYIDARREI